MITHPCLLRFVTIGVYGFTEEGFFAALLRAGVDTFCDVRHRRGMRGPAYAFANSRRLQLRLAEIGIRYFHFRELAPSPALRQHQAAADQATGTTKRQRSTLSEGFVAAYRHECLARFESTVFVSRLAPPARVAALFCVERYPAACHRSILAERLRGDLNAEVVHLLPA